jgi:hypothetical protein
MSAPWQLLRLSKKHMYQIGCMGRNINGGLSVYGAIGLDDDQYRLHNNKELMNTKSQVGRVFSARLLVDGQAKSDAVVGY